MTRLVHAYGIAPQFDAQTVRLVMVIDHLGSGGAERQFCMVAKELKKRGFDIRVVVFQPNAFSAYALQQSDIPITTLRPRNSIHLVTLMRSLLKRAAAHVVISFLKWSSLVVELSGVFGRQFAIVVSERSLEVDDRDVERMIRYRAHYLADSIVCNSFAQRDQLVRVVPRLEARTSVIVNGVDVDLFSPCATERNEGLIRILVLARYADQKNPFGFLEGIIEFRNRYPSLLIEVDWYGHLPLPSVGKDGHLAAHYRSELAAVSVHRRLSEAIRQRGLDGQFRLHGASNDVVSLYRGCDVVCVPSFYEGCSNVVGEALACGLPVLASDVSDNGRFVREGITGFLFDPGDPSSIADAIEQYAGMPPAQLAAMASAGRETARSALSQDTLGDKFASLIMRVLDARAGNT